MKITSLDIRKQEFNRSFRGYDMDEVDSFLQVVATQWQEMVDELRRSGEKHQEQQLKLDHYMKVEEALEEALQTARSSARITIENAEQKARNTLEDAEKRSIDLQKSADSERLQMKRDTAKYAVRQQEIVAKLRAFLMSEMEILSHFDAENIRPSLAPTTRKEIELVRDELADAAPSNEPVAELDHEPDESDAPEDVAFPDEPAVMSARSEGGSKSSWELLEEDEDMEATAEEKSWEEEDEFDEDDDYEEDYEVDDEENEDGEEEDDDEFPQPHLENALDSTTEHHSDSEIDNPPSWRVTPIFESDETEPVEYPDDVAQRNSENEAFNRSSSTTSADDDETEAEIRKIHQILKDLDEG
ncbi:DivIVA domain-containing protein [bacterium]|nr:DivIVA domain-containing protein [bacterium]